MADVWQVAGRGTAGDDAVRFLRELRQLRDGAGLGQAELAARAHYPYDLIKAAEAGPSLPDLPVLCAYVRGCGGTAEEWEERWRTLTRTPSLPVSASRSAGNSDAATAGAKIGLVTQVVDAPDPSVIIAALNRVAEGMAGGSPDTAPLTAPPRPALPGDDLSSPAVPSPTVFTPADVSLLDTFAATDSVADPVDVPVDVPVADSTGGSLGGPAEPAADDRPKGWDPIRVSAAWPAIGSEDTRGTRVPDDAAAVEAPVWDIPPWDAAPAPVASSAVTPVAGEDSVPSGPGTAPPASSAAAAPSAAPPSATSSAAASPADATGPGAGASAGPIIRQSAWARGVDAFGEPTGVARPGSRARTLMVAVVLICVLAVVLAIFV